LYLWCTMRSWTLLKEDHSEKSLSN
jgi:hypothetical protein